MIRRDPDELLAPVVLWPSLEVLASPGLVEKPVFRENRLFVEAEEHPMSRKRQGKWRMFVLPGE